MNGRDRPPPLLAHAGPGDLVIEEALALIRERSSLRPEVAVVLGSGLGDAVAADVRPDTEFAYEGLPGFPPPCVPGHAGTLVLGHLYGRPAAVFLGRIHLYEGHGIASTTLVPRLAAALGVDTVILTNASGGLSRSIRSGQLMVIRDHLNFLGANPLSGWRLAGGSPAFVALSTVYHPGLVSLAHRVAERAGVDLADGTYAAVPGPSYETPAETEFLRSAGADAVGMSTVPEAVAAVALGLRVLGISAVANVAGEPVTHEDVLVNAARASGDLRTILAGVVPGLKGIQTGGEQAPAAKR